MKLLNTNIGKCIYCGAHTPPLTREHILPRGIGGNWAPFGFPNALILQNASCEKCRQVTQKIEQECLISMMGPGRAKLGMKRKDRKTTTTTAKIDRIDGTSEESNLDWDYIPGAIVIPSYYIAGSLSNKSICTEYRCDYKIIIVAPAKNINRNDVHRIGVPLKANSKVFAQMLAKIALGITVARYGMNGFEPLVRNLILANPDEYGHWVGGYAGESIAEQKTLELHTVRLKENDTTCENFIKVEIRLFACYNGPTNYVVVGRRL